ncbi:MAG TPA: elongation factor P maturation arginine rhamnosyltransferase EarP [Alcaligenes sp.]|nr:elongation factor P maturation arginine rhamnosyltransferase EarP [Alcaligenes sp.]HRL26886.1 elongation factor P maturation arginine rhamnosyltransferase EarP [Alcaligenes sp.]
MPSIDLFCRVVDNFGDIGVCWRLARQLAAMPDVGQVRLWVDNLHSFRRIQHQVREQLDSQDILGVRIEHWHAARLHYPEPYPLLIEAFACELPAAVTKQLRADRHVWINLDYLSAENWVLGCHGLPSPQPGGAAKYFFFPGFLPGTGGLLREPGLLEQRAAFQRDDAAYDALLARLGVALDKRQALLAGTLRQLFLFCYPNAPVQALAQVLGQQDRDTLLLIPDSVAAHLPTLTGPRLHIQEIPHVDQADFDALLWRSDVNIVRGEDSLVRAIWAGVPMIWQPYIQDDNAHLDKLDAWLDTTPLSAPVRALHHAWSSADPAAATQALQHCLAKDTMAQWRNDARAYCAQQAQRADLAASLLSFYTQVVRKR